MLRSVSRAIPRFVALLGALASFVLGPMLIQPRVASAATWSQTQGPGVLGTYDLLEHDGFVFAGLQGDGVYRSSNEGASWQAANFGLAGRRVQALASGQGSLWAGLAYDGAGPLGVYRSLNDGSSWQPANSGIDGLTVEAILVRASDLFVADQVTGVHRSTNGGLSWSLSTNGLWDTSVTGLAAVAGGILASTSGSGLFRSTNDGASWDQVPTTEFFSIFSLEVSGSLVIAGGFEGALRSTNGGQSFTHVDMVSGGLNRTSDVAISGATIYATSEGAPGRGLFRSTDSGASFDLWDAQIDLASLDAILVLPSSATGGDRLLAGSLQRGILHSVDGGATWQDARAGLPAGGDTRSLFTAADGTLFAGLAGDGLYRSIDQGLNWIPSASDPSARLRNDSVSGFARRGSTLFASTFFAGLYRSSNGGLSWQLSSNGLPPNAQFVFDVENLPGALIAATSAGIYRSTNDGQSWVGTSANTGTVEDLAVSGSLGYAIVSTGFGSSSGIYRSTNDGANWTLVWPAGGSTPISIAAEGNFVYVGDLLNGMIRSTNQGNTFSDDSPQAGLPVFSLLATTTDLLAGSEPLSPQVFRSTNHGVSWTALPEGLPPASGMEALQGDGGYFYAATDGAGVWRRLRREAATVDGGGAPDPRSGTRPFPVRIATAAWNGDELHVQFDAPLRSPGTMRVFAANGRRQPTTWSGLPGAREADLSLPELPSGIYFLELTCGTERAVQKVIRVR